MIKLQDAHYGPIILTSELRAQGVQSREIAAAIEAGEMMRVAHGIVVTPEVWMDADLQPALACHLTGGVVGMLSAAMRHDLNEAIADQIEVLVPAAIARPPAGLPVKLIRTRNAEALRLGVDKSDFHGLELRVTDRARTVIDLYRIDATAHRQHALAALATYLGEGGEERLLRQYAKAFDIWDDIAPEIEAVTETLSRGMKP